MSISFTIRYTEMSHHHDGGWYIMAKENGHTIDDAVFDSLAEAQVWIDDILASQGDPLPAGHHSIGARGGVQG